jgi:protein TonB
MLPKKSENADLTKKSGLFLCAGLVLSLLFVTTAFEWRFYDDGGLANLGPVRDNFEEMLEIPQTEQPPTPPPQIQQPEINEVPDEEEIEEEIDVYLDIEITEDEVIEEIIFEEPVEEEVDRIFTVVENNRSFPVEQKRFYYTYKKIFCIPKWQRGWELKARCLCSL